MNAPFTKKGLSLCLFCPGTLLSLLIVSLGSSERVCYSLLTLPLALCLCRRAFINFLYKTDKIQLKRFGGKSLLLVSIYLCMYVCFMP